jgi:F-type H+-transporting ATPase subunit b
MKNWAIVFLLSSLLAALGLAQEHSTPPPTAAAGSEHAAASHGAEGEATHDAGDPMIMWKWINFGLLAIGLGYLASQHLPAFFAGRTDEIRQGIAEAQKLKAESDAKAAAMEQRMAKLGAEIEALRTQGKTEIAAEGERIRKETTVALAKVQAVAEAEIESMTKAAKHELKNYSVQLAVDLAGERIRARGGASEGGLFDRFVRDLEKKGANN